MSFRRVSPGVGTLSFAWAIGAVSLAQPPGAGPSRLQLEYLAFPQTVLVNASQALDICLVNGGDTGQVINDGSSEVDHVVVTIPTGTSFDDLTAAPLSMACASLNPSWACLGPVLGADQASLTLQPNGVVPIAQGESVCFRLTTVTVNAVQGLAQLGVDQQIDPRRAGAPSNDVMRVFKSDL